MANLGLFQALQLGKDAAEMGCNDEQFDSGMADMGYFPSDVDEKSDWTYARALRAYNKHVLELAIGNHVPVKELFEVQLTVRQARVIK